MMISKTSLKSNNEGLVSSYNLGNCSDIVNSITANFSWNYHSFYDYEFFIKTYSKATFAPLENEAINAFEFYDILTNKRNYKNQTNQTSSIGHLTNIIFSFTNSIHENKSTKSTIRLNQ